MVNVINFEHFSTFSNKMLIFKAGFVLFDYVPSTIFQLSSWVEPVLSED